jgi:hypothetical protein
MKTRIIPRTPDLVIRDPRTGARVPIDGLMVDAREAFWLRRLKDRDVLIAPVVAAPAADPVPAPRTRNTPTEA